MCFVLGLVWVGVCDFVVGLGGLMRWVLFLCEIVFGVWLVWFVLFSVLDLVWFVLVCLLFCLVFVFRFGFWFVVFGFVLVFICIGFCLLIGLFCGVCLGWVLCVFIGLLGFVGLFLFLV